MAAHLLAFITIGVIFYLIHSFYKKVNKMVVFNELPKIEGIKKSLPYLLKQTIVTIVPITIGLAIIEIHFALAFLTVFAVLFIM